MLVKTYPVTKQIPCPPKGQPGKTVKVSGTKVFVEPNPSDAKVTRDVTFVDQGGCAFVEIFLSGGSAKVPQSAFLDLAAAALANVRLHLECETTPRALVGELQVPGGLARAAHRRAPR